MLRTQLISSTEALLFGGEALAEWREANSFRVPGAEYTRAFKTHRWDGLHLPGKWLIQEDGEYKMRCSVGLALAVTEALGGEVPNAADPADVARWMAIAPRVDELRDYQRTTLERALVQGWGRAALATNAGKGAVLALMARWALDQDRRVLILCDELAVFDALRGELREWAGLGERELGLVRSGTKLVPPNRAVLAMVPTLARRKGEEWKEWLASQDVVLLDEADKATAKSWKNILRLTSASRWRVGFSGTFPDDPYTDLIASETLGPVLARARNIDMVERGVSARPTVELYRYDATHTLTFPGMWPKRWTGSELRNLVYDRCVFNNDHRHAFVTSLIRPDTPTAIIVNRVQHGHDLLRHIPGAVYLDGAVSESARIEALEAFEDGRTDIIIVTKILDRGSNRLGRARDLIFAAGEGSDRQLLQRLGRGLRRTNGKKELRVVDVMDVVTEQVLSEAMKSAKRAGRIAGYLNGAVAKRLALYNDEDFEVRIIA